MISRAAAVVSHAAASSPASANDITPGVLGFLVIAAMAAALFLLLRSMNNHLRRVRAVRDAGLAPGSDLGRAAVDSSANGTDRPTSTNNFNSASTGNAVNGPKSAGSANTGIAANRANRANMPNGAESRASMPNGAESRVRTDPADGTGGAAGV